MADDVPNVVPNDVKDKVADVSLFFTFTCPYLLPLNLCGVGIRLLVKS